MLLTDIGQWPFSEVELACTKCDFYELRGKRELAKTYGVCCSMDKIADQLRYPCKRSDCGVYYVDAERVVEMFTQPEEGKL